MPAALHRLRLGEILAAPSGLLLGVALFLPWYRFPSGNLDAWSAFAVTWILFAPAALAGLALTWVTVTRDSPALPVALAVWTTLLGVVAAVAVGVRLLLPPSGSIETCAGAWVGLAGAVLVAVAGWLSIRDERPSRGISVKLQP
jgi:prepilin signal peptidase PulO-like enzyme (type II secretory pathway)